MMLLDAQTEAHKWAKALLNKNKWCILDTETTGLDLFDEICQVSVITSELPNGWQTYVQPTVPITTGASKIHGITNEDIKDAPTFDQVFLHLMRRAGNRDIVIYNADFNLRLIQQSLKVHGIQLAFATSDRRDCRIFPNGGSIHDVMFWHYRWVRQCQECFGDYRQQNSPDGNYSALGDCKATLGVIRKMAAI